MNWNSEIWIRRNAEAKQQVLHRDLLANLVVERDFTSYELLMLTEDNASDVFYDPFLMQGMDEAVKLFSNAIEKNQDILIYGDYDADGFTSTAILYKFLSRLGANKVDVIIPNRITEGYGLSKNTIEQVLEINPDLLITVDNGIRSIEEVEILRENGILTLITDHHIPGPSLPNPDALIDPHIEGDNYPYKDLAGAGVAYKLCQAMIIKHELEPELLHGLAGLAMIGTIADVMPLRDENRHIVKLGLEEVKQDALPGVTALIESLKINIKNITAIDFAFRVCPRINAAGRMGENKLALDLLLSKNERDALPIVRGLEEINKARVNAQNRAIKESELFIEENPEILQEEIIVLKGEEWHTGIIGIVAARIADNFQKPTIICSIDGDAVSVNGSRLIKGSGRSTGQFNIFNVLTASQEYLQQFGGHKNACGITVDEAVWDDFYQAITRAARDEVARITSEFADDIADAKVSLYDAEVSIDAINMPELMALDALEPYGQANEKPVYLFRDVEVVDFRTLSSGKHLRLNVEAKNGKIGSIAFGFGDFANIIKPGDKISFLATTEINEWNQNVSCQLNIKNVLFPGEDEFVIADLIEEGSLESAKINAQDLVLFWQIISTLLSEKEGEISLKRVQNIARTVVNKYISLDLLDQILDIFVESFLLEKISKLNKYTYKLVIKNSRNRATLSDTETAKKLIEEGILEI